MKVSVDNVDSFVNNYGLRMVSLSVLWITIYE